MEQQHFEFLAELVALQEQVEGDGIPPWSRLLQLSPADTGMDWNRLVNADQPLPGNLARLRWAHGDHQDGETERQNSEECNGERVHCRCSISLHLDEIGRASCRERV